MMTAPMRSGAQVVLPESRFDHLDRVKVAIFAQQPRAQCRQQRSRIRDRGRYCERRR